MTDLPLPRPDGYEEPTPLHTIRELGDIALHTCGRCFTLVPVSLWDEHVEWHVALVGLLDRVESVLELLGPGTLVQRNGAGKVVAVRPGPVAG